MKTTKHFTGFVLMTFSAISTFSQTDFATENLEDKTGGGAVHSPDGPQREDALDSRLPASENDPWDPPTVHYNCDVAEEIFGKRSPALPTRPGDVHGVALQRIRQLTEACNTRDSAAVTDMCTAEFIGSTPGGALIAVCGTDVRRQPKFTPFSASGEAGFWITVAGLAPAGESNHDGAEQKMLLIWKQEGSDWKIHRTAGL